MGQVPAVTKRCLDELLRSLIRVGTTATFILASAAAFGTTAKELQGLPPDEQRGFVRGALEAYVYGGSIALTSGQTRLGDFFIEPAQCIASLNLKSPVQDMHRLVMQYLKNHPESLNQDAARAVRIALVDACAPGTKK